MKGHVILALLAAVVGFVGCKPRSSGPPPHIQKFFEERQREKELIDRFHASIARKPFRDQELPELFGPVIMSAPGDLESYLKGRTATPPEARYICYCLEEKDFESVQPQLFKAMDDVQFESIEIDVYVPALHPGLTLEDLADPAREIAWRVEHWRLADGKAEPIGD